MTRNDGIPGGIEDSGEVSLDREHDQESGSVSSELCNSGLGNDPFIDLKENRNCRKLIDRFLKFFNFKSFKVLMQGYNFICTSAKKAIRYTNKCNCNFKDLFVPIRGVQIYKFKSLQLNPLFCISINVFSFLLRKKVNKALKYSIPKQALLEIVTPEYFIIKLPLILIHFTLYLSVLCGCCSKVAKPLFIGRRIVALCL